MPPSSMTSWLAPPHATGRMRVRVGRRRGRGGVGEERGGVGAGKEGGGEGAGEEGEGRGHMVLYCNFTCVILKHESEQQTSVL